MDAAKSFDAYEIIGIITPGSVVTLMMALQWPEFRDLIGLEGLSVGGLGVFVIAAFVAGHLVQAIGNLLDGAFWLVPGLPSAWVRSPRQRLISPAQWTQFQAKVSAMEGEQADLATMDRRTWRAVTTRMYGRIQSASRAGRIDGCNRTYGLSRGLAAAFFVCGVWLGVAAGGLTPQVFLLLGLAVVALYRMVRSSIHYARSLVLTFLDLT